MKYLGIDFGSKRIGLALSDPAGKIAFPRDVVGNEGDKTLNYVVELCQREEVDEIVLGESLDYKGQPNPIQAKIENWKTKLESLSDLPVHFERETLTSAEAARNTGKEMLDASAAALILQAYLDKL